MGKRKGVKKSCWLFCRLNHAIAEGAEITSDWLTSVILLAKKKWHVTDFHFFRSRLLLVLKVRKIEATKANEATLRDYWYYKTV